MIQPVVTKIFYFTNILNLLEFEYSVFRNLKPCRSMSERLSITGFIFKYLL